MAPTKPTLIADERLEAMYDSSTARSVEDGLCTLYVAITRAKRRLDLIVPWTDPEKKVKTPCPAEILRAALLSHELAEPDSLGVLWSHEGNASGNGWADRLEAMDQVLGRSLELQQAIVRGFRDAGVPLLVGTDAPLTFVYPGFAVHRELALLVDSGLTPYEALFAATVAPARVLGVAAESGTIEPGKRADLVLVDGDPLEEIGNAARVSGVVVRGEWLDRAELDTHLARLAASYVPLAASVETLQASWADGGAVDLAESYRAMNVDDADLA